MTNVFDNLNVTDNMNDQIKQLTDLQSRTLEPLRSLGFPAISYKKCR